MPLHVKVAINENVIHRLHIARMDELFSNEQVSEYRVVEGKLAHNEIRYEEGIPFTHKYSDGALVCTQKAIAAFLGTD